MDKEMITPEQMGRAEVLVHELCVLRDEDNVTDEYSKRNANATRRVQITREISALLGYNVKEEELVKTGIKNDLNDK